MRPIIVGGIGTHIGKTLVSAILVEALGADYWKPIQTGSFSDRERVAALTSSRRGVLHREAYHLKLPLSPHAAAQSEGLLIDPCIIELPFSENLLIVEGCGGVMVPLNSNYLLSELFFTWEPLWLIVSKNYLGSINHTLLTIEFLKKHSQDIAGIIFNGLPNPSTESFILHYSALPCVGRIAIEPLINQETILCYAKKWKNSLKKTLTTFGIPSPSTEEEESRLCSNVEKKPLSTLMRM